MLNFTRKIENTISEIPANEIIVASKLYKEKLYDVPETVFYKTLQRMSNSEELVHVTKGIYTRPKNTRFGIMPLTEKEIIDYYTKENRGFCIGYALYNKKGLTTQTPSKYEILSNEVLEEFKKIKNVEIKKIPFKITKERQNAIEMLEIIQNYEFIEDVNPSLMGKCMYSYIQNFSEENVSFVLDNIKYKKSTIASLVLFLEFFGVKNNLKRYLSSLSTYRTIDVGNLYEVTHG